MSRMLNRITALLCPALFVIATFPAQLTAGMHPDVPILDSSGQPVVETGLPMSTMTTCDGDCHNSGFIAGSSDHADAGASELGTGVSTHDWQAGPGYFGGWNALEYDTDGLDGAAPMDLQAWLTRYGGRHVGGGPVAGMVEMDCLLCHLDGDKLAERAKALAEGDFAWANSLVFQRSGALEKIDGQWQWNSGRFQASGALQDGLLELRKPADENCGQCHGLVENSLDVPLVIPADRSKWHNTQRTGQLMSPQKLLNSGLNIADKEQLGFPFDVHSDRVVGCVNCHYSLNNPVYFRQREESRPGHLEFDPRRLSSAEYLERPLHQFAKGKSTLGLASSASENSLRRCESCHDAGSVHQWLPYRERHFASLACESCHVPKVFGPALMSVDWTMLDSDGEPARNYRGFEGEPSAVDSLVHGFRPALLPRAGADGSRRLAPYNIVTSWFWVAGDPLRPVAKQQLQVALFENGVHRPELIDALDLDGDGLLSAGELRLDDEARLAVVRNQLEQSGLAGPELRSEIIPFSISHNVVNGRWATRECANCHGSNSLLANSFPLSDFIPGGTLAGLPGVSGTIQASTIGVDPDGRMAVLPDSRAAGFYIMGLHAERNADALGLLLFLAVVTGVSGHAIGRYFASRKLKPVSHRRKRVYMYDAYERLWHWLQASAILLLLFTGLVIHKPQVFGIFSFPYMVRVHNVLGFILLINAALALFYNLASGEIRQYLPKPKGFVGRSIAQAMYYSRGIFAGQPHPLEKTREQKLNPLQQLTYLAILNVLLPAQVITGVLIWGLQRWPAIAASLGGLPALAVVHTLVAWTFAAFIVMHVYLTTAAGHTPGAGIRAMIEGWDEVDENPAASGENIRKGAST